MQGALIPTSEEVAGWLLETVLHVCRVEYYLHELRVGDDDPQRPHDIVGTGNKFEWEVARGFAVQHRDYSPAFFQEQVEPSRVLHRCQQHHAAWNTPNESSSVYDLRLGAVDAVCSMLEPRRYQGGIHTFEQIRKIARDGRDCHRVWLLEAANGIQRITKVAPPKLSAITSLDAVPNIGLSRHIHGVIRQRVAEARQYYTREHGYRV